MSAWHAATGPPSWGGDEATVQACATKTRGYSPRGEAPILRTLANQAEAFSIDTVGGYHCLLETMAVRDLRVYIDALDGAVAHCLDVSGLECDAVLHKRKGPHALVEMKLGGK